MEKTTYKESFKIGIVAILIYIIVPEIYLYILDYLNISFATFSIRSKIFLIFLSELLTLTLLIILYNKDLKKDIKDLKKNYEKYADVYIKYWIIALIIMAVSNKLITLFTGSVTSSNEASVRILVQKVPIYMFFSSSFYAPLCEELIFRKSIKKLIPNKYLFVIASTLIFGGIHVVTSMTAWHDIFYLIPYCSTGFVLAYAYQKTDNILVSTSLHFIHNTFLMIFLFFIYFL